jgi:NTE family protein
VKAYAVLSGGGAKGAALAGCLAAAEGRGIEWVGCGGTSAGALVAFLSTIGHSGQQIQEIFKRLKPVHILEDSGAALEDVERWWNTVLDAVRSRWMVTRAVRLWMAATSSTLNVISTKGGIYSGEKLTAAIAQQGRNARRTATIFAADAPAVFRQLLEAGCPLLKVVASNISTGRAVVFSAADTPEQSVVEAIRASMSYPFVYEPVRNASGHRLVDGGLASNLPCFLFAREHAATRHPVFAFDLAPNDARTDVSYGLFELGRDLLDTALEASDGLFVEHMSGVHHVRIPVPAGVETFSRNLSDDQIDNLFNSGFTAAGRVLDHFPLLQYAHQAGGVLQKELQTLCGDKKLFQLPLWGLKTMIEERSRARDARAHIMLPTGRPDGSRILVYGFGFRHTDADSDLELDETAGCTGRSLTRRGPVVADLHDARQNHAAWSMTSEQQARVAPDRMSMLSVPIFTAADGPPDGWTIRGILSVDSSTPLDETGWVQATGAHGALKAEILLAMTAWADVCAKILT